MLWVWRGDAEGPGGSKERLSEHSGKWRGVYEKKPWACDIAIQEDRRKDIRPKLRYEKKWGRFYFYYF
jgi:hypothetical protein